MVGVKAVWKKIQIEADFLKMASLSIIYSNSNSHSYEIAKSLIIAVHSCFSRSVNCGAATMENGFQVTVLDSEALES